MKTMEILLAIVLSTIFLLAIIPKFSSNPLSERKTYLIYLEDDPGFRDFAAAGQGCFLSGTDVELDAMIRRYVPAKENFAFCIDNFPESLPDARVFADTLFLAGNLTEVRFIKVRLYYWEAE